MTIPAGERAVVYTVDEKARLAAVADGATRVVEDPGGTTTIDGSGVVRVGTVDAGVIEGLDEAIAAAAEGGVIPDATESAAGLMSAESVRRLNETEEELFLMREELAFYRLLMG